MSGNSAPEIDVLLVMLDDAINCGLEGCAEAIDAPVELLDYLDQQREFVNESGS